MGTVLVAAVVADQVTKAIAIETLSSGAVHIGPLHLRLVANRGTFMGILALPTWLLTSLTLGIVAVAARNGWRTGASPIGYALLIGGALGNLIDRYLQRPDFPSHAVVDWLSFGGTTFNLADVFIVATVLLLVGDGSREAAPMPQADAVARE
ncbi:MAG: signal peptidase II [Acidimicrobiia bacterium]